MRLHVEAHLCHKCVKSCLSPQPREHRTHPHPRQIGRELNTDADLPTDLAENHDFYAHGAPKGLDRP